MAETIVIVDILEPQTEGNLGHIFDPNVSRVQCSLYGRGQQCADSRTMFHLVLFAFLFQPTICQTPERISQLFGRYSNQRFPNNNDLTLGGVSLEECARRCVEEPAFVCRSFEFDYTTSVQTCHLSRENRASSQTGLERATGVYHYEKKETVVDTVLINQYPLVPYPVPGTTRWTCRSVQVVDGGPQHRNYFFKLEYVYALDNDNGYFTWTRSTSIGPGDTYIRVVVPKFNGVSNLPIGVVSCSGKQGEHLSKASTVKMSREAPLKPKTMTLTVNREDQVILTTSEASGSGNVFWEKRNVFSRLRGWETAGTSLNVASQAQVSDEGNYVFYRQNEQDRALVGITRVIVRQCPAGKYGVPSCTFDCPVCYHGGWCDDVSGECVCPPGFGGKNCELGCDRIAYGANCQWNCNNTDIAGDNDDPDCRRVMLCLPDPYGCSCARGWKGLDCQTQCAEDEYGAGCTQRCACQNGGVCDPVKGCVCVDDWSGPTCEDKKFRLVIDPPSLHITRATSDAEVTVTCSCHPWGEDDCPTLTFEPVNGGQTPQSLLRFPDQANSRWKALRFTPEQKLGTLGFRCTGGSTYQESTAFTVTGMSPSVTGFSTIHRSTNAGSIELNAGTDVTFVCETAGDPLPQTSDVALTFSGRNPGLPTQMPTAGGNTIHSRLLRNVSVTDAGQYGCLVRTVAGQDDRMVTVDVKVPPTTTVPPPVRATSTTELAVDIQLSKLAWTGNGEIIAKDIQYKLSHGSSWKALSNNEEGEVRIRNLSPSTTYNVRLVLSRPGEGGRGRPGPISTVSTPETMAGPSTGVVAGAAGGVSAVVFVIIVVAVIFFIQRRRKQRPPRHVRENISDVEGFSDTPLVSDQTGLRLQEATRTADVADGDPTSTRHHGEHHGSKPTIMENYRPLPLKIMAISDRDLTWDDISLTSKLLGTGNFGEVRKGTVNLDGERVPSAIKVLKRGADEAARQDFQQEVDIMRHVGYHPYIINLLGTCDHQGQQYMALEMAGNGDLKKYLRTSRVLETTSPAYGNTRQTVGIVSTLSPVQLLRIACDVATGMEHLSSKDVIHRDLAARNVLLTDSLIAKVADFGLSRGDGIYEQTSQKAVPFRSTALEALSSRIYTTQSDVDPRCLVEAMKYMMMRTTMVLTLVGGTPYSGMKSGLLLRRLREGYRMPKPRNCDEDLYQMMLQCWQRRPEDRPTFSDLVEQLKSMMEDKSVKLRQH
ncbi:hypothetical protein Bbelb_377960 [Branchiostoma belcheri]|nr:hypothetical protein Bbelb_377960 [Branchiostoma belcheri]